ITYTNDLTFENINPLLNIFLRWINKSVYGNSELLQNAVLSGSGITKYSLEHEISKVRKIQNGDLSKEELFRLEDYRYLKGDLNNFIESDIDSFAFYNGAIRDIYSLDTSKVIRAMLTIDDYALQIGWTWLGNKYFFGNQNYWEIILTASNTDTFDYTDYFATFLGAYRSSDEDLQMMIDKFLATYDDWDWRYYFVKYESMTQAEISLSRDDNIYAWDNGFKLEKMGGSNLNAFHLNPYIKTVAEKLKITPGTVPGADNSYLVFGNFKVFSFEDGWHIQNLDSKKHSNLIKKFTLLDKESHFLLKENKKRDRIEILIEFIGDMNKQTA
ncbi:MAG: hypothetical protein COB85_09060, partial [Bacteroidetes bacterium]